MGSKKLFYVLAFVVIIFLLFAPDSEEVNFAGDCSGCFEDGVCLPYGIRRDGDYCSLDGSLIKQKVVNRACENNFECNSNLCISDECVGKGVWNRFMRWFKPVFG